MSDVREITNRLYALVDEIIDVCETCYMAYHYGANSVEIAHDPTTDYAPLGRIPAGYDITDISELEYTVFSKCSCDGCGSLLAGSRWPLLVSEMTV